MLTLLGLAPKSRWPIGSRRVPHPSSILPLVARAIPVDVKSTWRDTPTLYIIGRTLIERDGQATPLQEIETVFGKHIALGTSNPSELVLKNCVRLAPMRQYSLRPCRPLLGVTRWYWRSCLGLIGFDLRGILYSCSASLCSSESFI